MIQVITILPSEKRTTELVRRTSSQLAGRLSAGSLGQRHSAESITRLSRVSVNSKKSISIRFDAATTPSGEVREENESSDSDVEEVEDDELIHDGGESLRPSPHVAADRQHEQGPQSIEVANISLREQLEAAISRGAGDRRFLPYNAFQQLMTDENISKELLRANPQISAPELRQLVSEVVVPSTARSVKPNKATFAERKKIFAILVLLDRSSDIKHFISSDITDSHLPIPKRPNTGPPEAESQAGKDPLPSSFPTTLNYWSPKEFQEFLNLQWTLLAPFFGTLEDSKSPPHFVLPDDAILPFVAESAAISGGFGHVWSVQIHSSHHGFGRIPAKPPEHFAIKQVRSRDIKEFQRERSMLKRFSGSGGNGSHLVDLLATYKQGDRYYMIFDWANGGNLLNFWRSNPKPVVDHRHTVWMLEQVEGLANAIARMHNAGKSYYSDGIVRHGDIKAENVLVFKPSDDSELGELKISDLGLARFQTKPAHRPKRLAGTLTYRPPECDIPDAPISQSYDIWSLGCLFLEFVTWYLLGHEAVSEEFPAARTKSSTSVNGHGTTADAGNDSFFTLQTNAAGSLTIGLNPAVTKLLYRLRRHQESSPLLREFLDLIEDELLVIDAKDRLQCVDIVDRLEAMRGKLERDPQYGMRSLKIMEAGFQNAHLESDGPASVRDIEDASWDDPQFKTLSGIENVRLVFRDGIVSPLSKFDKYRSRLEEVTDSEWNWWPLPRIRRPLPESHAQLRWTYDKQDMSITLTPESARRWQAGSRQHGGGILPSWRSSPNTPSNTSSFKAAISLIYSIFNRVARWGMARPKSFGTAAVAPPLSAVVTTPWKESYFCIDKSWVSATETHMKALVSVNSMKDDSELFRNARRVLGQTQGSWLQRLFWYKSITRLHLAKFHFLFDNDDRVKAFACSSAQDIQAIHRDYEYTSQQFIDLDVHMRIIAEILLHGVRRPSLGRGQKTVLEGIPKLNAPPGLKREALTPGWGFHAGQGPCLKKICIWITTILVLGCAFVPFWLVSISKIDLQNAFAPVTFLATLICIILAIGAVVR